ncbi:hypothetical protein HT585_24280 [Ensifer sp. HO-A22]|uniref:Uncharacterized protein n=1 Tax=Ensifer oleiphilus TaxID=2742698 RepID=A0A7Y6UQT1_9HYPH|nr:hypothetical protein [Ensifer oleiphilus]NVD41988.1 hypothetical protein [Ensifer oleiphilus]
MPQIVFLADEENPRSVTWVSLTEAVNIAGKKLRFSSAKLSTTDADLAKDVTAGLGWLWDERRIDFAIFPGTGLVPSDFEVFYDRY